MPVYYINTRSIDNSVSIRRPKNMYIFCIHIKTVEIKCAANANIANHLTMTTWKSNEAETAKNITY